MSKLLILTVFLSLFFSVSFSQVNEKNAIFINRIYQEMLTSKETYGYLKELCKKYPRRLSGSAAADGAVQWAKSIMEKLSFDKVYLQEVMVPHWVRGEAESATFINNKGKTEHLSVLALGRSVATPKNGLTAEIAEVSSLEEIAELGKSGIRGKIVFINKPFEEKYVRTFEGYKETVAIRTKGPSEAARYGAIACIIRSVTTADDDYAHTGALKYDEDAPVIPAAALGVRSAEKLARSLHHNPKLKLTLTINSQTLPDKLSYNVVGEITGSENPDSIIMVCGHLDAWDVGEGAHDDGSGCMHAIIALKTLKNMGYKPKNTLRVVLFMNEENGIKGGDKYAELAVKNKEKHIFALESDAGGFVPRRFSMKVSPAILTKVQQWINLFPDDTIERFEPGGGGADIGALNEQTGVPVGQLLTDSQRYFDFHHSNADVIAAVNARELELGTASVASLVYLIDQFGL